MKRLAATAAFVAVAVGTALSGSAYAAPRYTTSVALSCDKNVDATVSLTLEPSQSDTGANAVVDISCGPNSNVERQHNRVEIATGTFAAGRVTITSWTRTGDTTRGSCATSGSLPYKDSCTNDAGIGSQLTVR